jgi:hypothetical protein
MMIITPFSSWNTFFLLCLLGEDSQITPTNQYGTASLKNIFTYTLPSNERQASRIWSLLYDYPELAFSTLTTFTIWCHPLMSYMICSFWCKHMENIPNPIWKLQSAINNCKSSRKINWSNLVHRLLSVCWSIWIQSLHFVLINLISFLLISTLNPTLWSSNISYGKPFKYNSTKIYCGVSMLSLTSHVISLSIEKDLIQRSFFTPCIILLYISLYSSIFSHVCLQGHGPVELQKMRKENSFRGCTISRQEHYGILWEIKSFWQANLVVGISWLKQFSIMKNMHGIASKQ